MDIVERESMLEVPNGAANVRNVRGKEMKLHRYENVDNKKFLGEFFNREGLSDVTEFMAECFMNIGIGLSHRKNFQRYTYRDEMILDGLEYCVKYVHNFDPEKSGNPHSYFTTIMWRAFIRRIEKEKKQEYIKFLMTDKFLKSNYYAYECLKYEEKLEKKRMKRMESSILNLEGFMQ